MLFVFSFLVFSGGYSSHVVSCKIPAIVIVSRKENRCTLTVWFNGVHHFKKVVRRDREIALQLFLQLTTI